MSTKKQTEIIKGIIERLSKLYGNRTIALKFANPLELLIATILSAQANDETVNRVTETLFKKYNSAYAYATAPIEELQQDIKSINYYRTKAKTIKACCQKLIESYNGQVPASMEELLKLPGVGRKTANVVLSFAFKNNEGIVVDTHVARVAQRLGLTKNKKPDLIEKDLMALFERELWDDISNWLIWHGRVRCKAKNPDCPHCELLDLCPSRTC